MEIRKLVPDVYYKESRDFSYIGRLLEIVVNYNKTGADLVKKGVLEGGDQSTPSMILDLLAITLGFETKHEYITDDLIAICSCFLSIVKKKGSLDAIIETVNVLLHSQKIDAKINNSNIYADGLDKCHLIIEVPAELTDRILIEDLFEYILPTGMTYSFLNVEVSSKQEVESTTKYTDVLEDVEKKYNYQLSQVSNENNLGMDETNRSAVTTGKVLSVEIS